MSYNVLFDESHNETWTIEKYKAFSNSLENPLYYSYTHISDYLVELLNCKVRRNVNSPITSKTLEGVSILVISHPADPTIHKGCGGNPIFSKDEINCIKDYVRKGGGLFVLYEYEVNRWKSNINDLLTLFGIKFNNDVVKATYQLPAGEGETAQFVTNNLSDHPICQSIKQVSYYAGCSIEISDQQSQAIVKGPNNETIVAAGTYKQGRICAIGDTDIFALPYIEQFDNFSFFLNIIQWLGKSSSINLIRPNSFPQKDVFRPSIFLSYAREDEELVEKIYHILKFYGCSPWLDKKSIVAGENFELAIMEGINKCDFFMPCISKNSIDKRGVLQKEIRTALSIAEGMLDNDIYIIPVRLDNSIPQKFLSKYQWVDASDQDFIKKITSAIVEGISRRTN